MNTHARRHRAGLTLIELLITMIVGLVVLSTVTAYVRSTDRSINGAVAREDYSRKGRYLGLALRRDLGDAGVGVMSQTNFGTVAVFGDTITILKVPYEPNPDPAYNIAVQGGGTVTSNHANNCGANCMRLRRVSPGTPLTLVSGMVALLTQSTTRRLLLVNTVATPGGANDSIAVTYRSTAGLLKRFSIVNGTPLGGITNTNTTVQRMDMVAYWRDAQNNLWRATRMNPATGAFVGEIITTGCTQFEVQLVFRDGGVANNADSTVANRRFNDINAITVRATVTSDVVDSRINNGVPLGRTYTFRIQPRNLLYERNRTT